ncbi:pre-mRNA cleavage factor Im 25 kDa subunit 2-like isoform X1 [Tripterygium wilfordii]|uniref:pre-mRNA cleavage factor Im 25 kDa subunit 2-like isoform X1 n=1 Tax=Tripterygium wilfordii TaxID=458696 RepID=UPI0018F831CD|nr:pre-mRNA cleavage factor Im 25 kDa subunit 2-like isoform X1 [Tripterygium wilfordii]
MRTSVEAVMLVEEHRHPHLLFLRFQDGSARLPGGRLRPGENEKACLKRKLCSQLGVSPTVDWQIGDCMGVWWRPNFEREIYPYCPPHITKPKEQKKIFVVQLPERQCFHVPRNITLAAVPLFDIHDNSAKYGRIIATVPVLLSRFKINKVCNCPCNLSELCFPLSFSLLDKIKLVPNGSLS